MGRLEDDLRAALESEALEAPSHLSPTPLILRRTALRRGLVGGFAASAIVAICILAAAGVSQISRDGGILKPGLEPRTGGTSSDPSEGVAPVGDCQRIPSRDDENRWISNPAAQDRVAAIGRYLEQEFGAPPGSPGALPQGLIGLAADDTTQTEFVVLDPMLYEDAPTLASRLRTVADAAVDEPGLGEFTIDVVSSCNSAQELLRALNVLASLGGDPKGWEVGYGYGLDPYTSTWVVTVDHSSDGDDFAAYLVAELGNLVTIERANLTLY